MWCWRWLLRIPRTARRSNHSILKDINPQYSLEVLLMKLKLQYVATWSEEMTHWKRPLCWERLKAEGEGAQQRMRWLDIISDDEHEFEQTPGDSGGHRKLVCCSPWICRVGHDIETEQQHSWMRALWLRGHGELSCWSFCYISWSCTPKILLPSHALLLESSFPSPFHSSLFLIMSLFRGSPPGTPLLLLCSLSFSLPSFTFPMETINSWKCILNMFAISYLHP